jgi:prophage antirepressor-like protein
MTNALIPFAFDDALVRVRLDENGEPWFVAKDVCAILELGNPSEAVKSLDEDEKGSIRITEGTSPEGGNPNMLVISESGLYSLIFKSRKPEARRVRKWATSEVLPSIRKTGAYATKKALPGHAAAPLDLSPGDRFVLQTMPEETRRALLKELSAVARTKPEAMREYLAAAVEMYLLTTPQFIAGSHIVSVFWKVFDMLTRVADEGLDHSCNPTLIAVNLPEFVRVAEAMEMPTFNLKELSICLRNNAGEHELLHVDKRVRSRILGKSISCWVFKRRSLNPVVVSDDGSYFTSGGAARWEPKP